MITAIFNRSCLILLFPMVSFAVDISRGSFPQNIQMTLTQQAGVEFQLQAKRAPLKRVLYEIEQATGITIHYSALPQDQVSATCVGSTVRQILECLLGSNTNLVIRYPEGVEQQHNNDKPADIWLLGSSIAMQQTDIGLCKQNAEHVVTVNNQTITEQAKAKLWQIMERSKAEDPEMRSQAIANMAHIKTADDSDANKIRQILEQTLADDQDARVRAQAISVLMRRDGESASTELHQALLDNDATVRLMALEYLENDSALLEQALSDNDQDVRYLAAMKLKMLNTTKTYKPNQ